MAPELTYRECLTCHREFTVLKKRVRQTGKGLYCTRSCAQSARTGKRNPGYKHGDSGNASRYTKPYKMAHPEIAAAHQAVSQALKSFWLVKPQRCEQCEQPKRLDAHHDDYTKPLEVRWLCRLCHNALHKRSPKPRIDSRIDSQGDRRSVGAVCIIEKRLMNFGGKVGGSRPDRTDDSLLKRRIAH